MMARKNIVLGQDLYTTDKKTIYFSKYSMLILTVETSCDETSVAIGEIKKNQLKLLSHVVSSQVKLHSKWGGVVPDLASREHLKNLIPVMDLASRKAGFKSSLELSKKVDVIGVTEGPGLIPSLLLGVNFAKALSYSWKKPLIPINHMEGHIYSSFVDATPKRLNLGKKPFPLLALLVSGGHTMLVFMKKHLDYKILGETVDDAVGEAFDKVARILDLPYPGGPHLSKIAKKGNPDFHFSIPMEKSPNLNFSFSGLKTATLYKALEKINPSQRTKIFGKSPKPDLKIPLSEQEKSDLARAFEEAAVGSLILKTRKALKKMEVKTFVLGGGVASNNFLREKIKKELKKEFPKTNFLLPKKDLTGDNAAMLLPVTYFKWKIAKKEGKTKKYFDTWKNLEAEASLSL